MLATIITNNSLEITPRQKHSTLLALENINASRKFITINVAVTSLKHWRILVNYYLLTYIV